MRADYTFLPWARQGLANRISGPDPNPAASARADIDVKLTVSAQGLDGGPTNFDVNRKVQLYGPGDVIGVDARAVVRIDPRDWITNYEPNYLAAIEFYDETLPWRYTPTAADAPGARLRPWIMLIVLGEDEFASGTNPQARPLPFITLTDAALANALPAPDALWAWAHVHVNRGLTASDNEIVATDRDAVAARLGSAVAADPDIAYSRIVCPRRLAPNATYHAFLVPVFESGRLAGLGLDPNSAPSITASAWTSNGPDKNDLPAYYQWQFRTGALGDFETLVRLLQPRPVDKRVGTRAMDVQQPGANLPGILDPRFQGVLQLGGALRVPRASLNPDELAAVLAQENWAQPPPHPFQRQLAAFINLADDYTQVSAGQANAQPGVSDVTTDPDPLVTPPLYGRWHALTPRLHEDRDGTPVPYPTNWVHELNLDPRFRVPAGFGTRVVQDTQEELMAAAWEQVGDVLEGNERMRRFKLAQQVSFVWHRSHLQAVADSNPGRALALTAPVQPRVMAGGVTMRTEVAASAVPQAVVAPAMRRIVRPGGSVMRALPPAGGVRHEDLVERVNRGDVVTAPPKVVPPGVVTVRDVAAGALPAGVPAWLVTLLRKAGWVVVVPLLVAIVLALLVLFAFGLGLALALIASAVLVAAGFGLSFALWRVLERVRAADSLREEGQTPASVDSLPASPDFKLTEPSPTDAAVTLEPDGSDSAEGARFKVALKDLNEVLQASVAADTVGENGPRRRRLDLERVANNTLTAIDPALTLPRLAATQIRIPPRISDELAEDFVEAMAYPVFDLPMYAPLRDRGAELLIPNVNLIDNNTVTLLETNQKFIESYMVGLNHEFARELLWREYPTDQRGSYFRQFWDVSSFLAGASANDADLREKLRDIPPLHRWPRASRLGDHDARERPGDNEEEEVVLVIRGELLKRYPTAVIYAQAATWARLPNGDVDRTKERSLVELTDAEESDPPRAKLRTPLYQAKIEPDIYFFGFDLTAPEARGGTGERRDDPAGWFFVIKERPGEPRFGFDDTSAEDIVVYNDLGWDRVPVSGEFIRPVGGNPPVIPSSSPAGEAEKEVQRLDDVHVLWDDNVSAAELAYVMYQEPVMVGVHAAEMLPEV